MSFLIKKAPASLPAIRIGDHLALDFLNSIASPQGEPLEWISDGPAFLQWLEDAGKIQPNERSMALKTFPPSKLDDVSEQARQLREWFRDLLVRVKEREALTIQQEDIDKLNSSLITAAFFRQLQRDQDHRLQLVWKRSSLEPHMLLAPVAEAIAELLCDGDLRLVSRCGGPGCTLWFYDRTKSHRRRWCSQAVCGNRVRVHAFRQRNRGAS